MKFIFALVCLFALVLAVAFAAPAVQDESIIAVPSEIGASADDVVNPEDPQGTFLLLLKKKLLLLG